MRTTPDGDGLAVSCTLAAWLADGPALPGLERVTRVTLTDQRRDSTLRSGLPPALARALVLWCLGGSGDGLSRACLAWARGRGGVGHVFRIPPPMSPSHWPAAGSFRG